MAKIFTPDGTLSENVAPSEKELKTALEEALDLNGIPIEVVEMLEGEWCLYQRAQGLGVDKILPMKACVVRNSGYMLLYALTGPAGLHARVIENRRQEIEDNQEDEPPVGKFIEDAQVIGKENEDA